MENLISLGDQNVSFHPQGRCLPTPLSPTNRQIIMISANHIWRRLRPLAKLHSAHHWRGSLQPLQIHTIVLQELTNRDSGYWAVDQQLGDHTEPLVDQSLSVDAGYGSRQWRSHSALIRRAL